MSISVALYVLFWNLLSLICALLGYYFERFSLMELVGLLSKGTRNWTHNSKKNYEWMYQCLKVSVCFMRIVISFKSQKLILIFPLNSSFIYLVTVHFSFFCSVFMLFNCRGKGFHFLFPIFVLYILWSFNERMTEKFYMVSVILFVKDHGSLILLLDQDFEGLLNNLQDWELSFKDKDKRLKSQFVGKDKLVLFNLFCCFLLFYFTSSFFPRNLWILCYFHFRVVRIELLFMCNQIPLWKYLSLKTL